jgi:hypothetical protein
LLPLSEGKRMQKVVRDIGLFVVAPLAILGGLTAWMFAATAQPCSNAITQQLPSPDGGFNAVLFVRSCTTAPGFSSNISILVKDGILADGPGNLFASDGHPEQLGFSLQWQSTGKDSLQLNVTSKIRGTVLHADPIWSANPNITATYQFGNTTTTSGH